MAEMTLEEALAAAEVDNAPVNDIITIDPETRAINLPSSEMLFGVEQDKDVERKYFKCPRIVGDNIDLSTHQIYIAYVTAKDRNGSFDRSAVAMLYYCEDMTLDETGNYIKFSWKLSENVLDNPGFVAFAVSAKYMDGDALKTRWKTTPAVGTVLMTVPDNGKIIAELYPDIIAQLIYKMEAVEEIATPEAMQGYVNTYLAEHPVELDETLTDNTKAAPAGLVGELKGEISALRERVDQLEQNGTSTGIGLSTEAIDKLEEVGNYLAYTTADGGSKWTELISILRNGSSGGSGETEKTLTSISATYTGGDVLVGTALTSLTGITVTATYSDSSTSAIAGYELSGEIAEGNNTITVSYGGKTTTFTVTGINETGGETENNPFDSATWSTGILYSVDANGKVKENANDNFSYTDYVVISGYTSVHFADTLGTGLKQTSVWFFDADKTYISNDGDYFRLDNATYPSPLTVEIPVNAFYAKINIKTAYLEGTEIYVS